MAIQVSPGVAVSEVDLTTSVPAISTSIGGFAGVFNWGPANTPVQISSEVQLNNTFGNPDNNTAVSFFTAANFLSYSNNLQVVRAQMHNANNATASGVLSPPIPNDSFYFDNYFQGSGEVGNPWAARYMGSLGNSLQVIVWSANNWATDVAGSTPTTEFARKFDYAPTTSPYVAQLNPSAAGNVNDEIHIMVVDATGAISGYANTVLEKYQSLSVLSDATAPDGSSNYYKNVIYSKSKYIHWLGIPQTNTANWGNTTTAVLEQYVNTSVDPIGLDVSVNSIMLMGGTNGTIGNNADVSSAIVNAISYNLYDPEKIDVSLLMAGNSDANVIGEIVDAATNRKDCIAFFSPDLANTQNTQGAASAIVNYVNTLDVFSSYAVCDSGWKYQYDKYNDIYRWVPLNGDIAGLCAYTDSVQAPWWSPAGLNRGSIKNVVKLAFNPNQTDRDTLYKAGINPVVSFPGQGTVLFGDKTLLNRPSAFDRINVRRLFIVLEKSISQAARSTLFEFNDEFTQSQFVALIDPFLRTVQAQRGIYSYKIVCDSTNNTPEVIDANKFVGDIYIQPARSINYIQLNFVATRTGVDFSQIVGQF